MLRGIMQILIVSVFTICGFSVHKATCNNITISTSSTTGSGQPTSHKEHPQNRIQSGDNRSTRDMESILQQAVSGNSAVFRAKIRKTSPESPMSPTLLPVVAMTKSTWSLEAKTKNPVHSVPVVTSDVVSNNISNNTNVEQVLSDKQNYSSNRTRQTSPKDSLVSMLWRSSRDNRGVYIPMTMLSRQKRQAHGHRLQSGLQQDRNRRVLLLMNPNNPSNRTINRSRLNGGVLVLVRQNNTTSRRRQNQTLQHNNNNQMRQQHADIRAGTNNNGGGRNQNQLRHLRQAVPHNQLAGQQRVFIQESRNQIQPAIQSINDLNLIDLDPLLAQTNIPGSVERSDRNVSHAPSNNGINQAHIARQSSINEINRVAVPPQNTGEQQPQHTRVPVQHRNRSSHVVRTQRPHARGNFSSVSGTNQQVSENTSNRNSNALQTRSRTVQNNSKRNQGQRRNAGNIGVNAENQRVNQFRPAVEAQLTHEHPVSTRRIFLGRPSNNISTRSSRRPRAGTTSNQRNRSRSSTSSARSSVRPLVRAMSTASLQRQIQARRGSPRSIRTRTGATGQRRTVRTNQRRRARPQTGRRNTIRRRVQSRPPDPFTRRFSAGFQRGSTLLIQPPLDFTGFDGTVRENGRFNGALDTFPALPPNLAPNLIAGPDPFLFGPNFI